MHAANTNPSRQIHNPLKTVRVNFAQDQQDQPCRNERNYDERNTQSRPSLPPLLESKCYCCKDEGILSDHIFRAYIDPDYKSYSYPYRCQRPGCNGLVLSREEMASNGMNPGSKNTYKINPGYLKSFGESAPALCEQVDHLERFRFYAQDVKKLFDLLSLEFSDFKIRNLISLSGIKDSRVFVNFMTDWFSRTDLPDLGNASDYATWAVLKDFAPPTDVVGALTQISRGVRSQYRYGFFDDTSFVRDSQSLSQSLEVPPANPMPSQDMPNQGSSGLTSIQSSLDLRV